jgi:hypothetical protein
MTAQQGDWGRRRSSYSRGDLIGDHEGTVATAGVVDRDPPIPASPALGDGLPDTTGSPVTIAMRWPPAHGCVVSGIVQ